VLGAAAIVVWADRRYTMGHGRVFALYVALYCAGRVWIEALRIDDAPELFGLRRNVWVSIVVGIGAVAYLVISSRERPGREAPELLRGNGDDEEFDAPEPDAGAEASAAR
jgi:prolipoprotein diacylglyceryltransferase